MADHRVRTKCRDQELSMVIVENIPALSRVLKIGLQYMRNFDPQSLREHLRPTLGGVNK